MKRKTLKKMLSMALTSALCLTALGGQVMPVSAAEETGTETVCAQKPPARYKFGGVVLTGYCL